MSISFFVISGYLIGSQIYRAALTGKFSWRSFYAKRARRILPALIATLLVTYIVMVLVATPSELHAFGRDAVATLLSVSNITLWRSIDYFNPTADLNPLLMTWSLAVEEQFYIFAPFLILLLPLTRVRYRIIALITLIGASLALAAWGVYHKPSPTFYLLPTRAWELGAGVLLGVLTIHRPLPHARMFHSRLGTELRALAGLVLIAAPVALYTRETPFLGLAAIPPVLGTVLLLNTELSFINRRLLSCTPMRFFGLISYSLYLWHWPLISITHLVLEKPPGVALRVVLMLFSFGLAWCSYRFIETPFRRSASTEKRSLIRYGATIGAVALVASAAIFSHGFPQRWPASFVQMDHDASTYDPVCLASSGDTTLNTSPECMPHTSSAQGAVALVGDSHAAALAPGLRQRVEAHNKDFVVMTKSSCAFLDSVSRAQPDHPQHFSECARFNENVMAHLINAPRIDTVVLAGYWQAGLEDEAGRYRPTQAQTPDQTASDNLQHGLERAIARLEQAGKRVILARDVPLVKFSPVKRLATCANPTRALLNGSDQGDGACNLITSNEWQPARQASNVIDNVAARDDDLVVADPSHYLCSNGKCQIAGHGRIFYIDYQHLAHEGALVATQWFDDVAPAMTSEGFAARLPTAASQGHQN